MRQQIARYLAIGAALAALFAAGDALAQARQSVQSEPGSGNAGYPPGATPAGNSQTATTGGITISIGPASGAFTYLCGVSYSAGSATTAIATTVTLTNTNVTTILTVFAPPTASGPAAPASVTFTPCLRSNTVNQNITLTATALSTGGANQALSAWGFTE